MGQESGDRNHARSERLLSSPQPPERDWGLGLGGIGQGSGDRNHARSEMLLPNPQPPTHVPRVRLGARGSALGRRLLIVAVVGWFAVLILVPALALIQGALAG